MHDPLAFPASSARRRLPGARAALPFALLGAAGLAYAACGGDDEGGGASTSATATSSGTTGAGGEEGIGGNFPSGTATSTTTTTSGAGGAGGATAGCNSDGGGAFVFAKSFGDAADQFTSDVAVDAQGNLYVSGAFDGSLSFGGTTLTTTGSTDAFIAKLDPNGAPLWAKSFGSAKAQSATGIALDSGGNVVVVGHFLGSINLGGATLSAPGCCYQDVFVAKFDGAGNHLWSKQFGDVNIDYAYAVAVDGSNNVLVAGQFQAPGVDFGGGTLANGGGFDLFVAKLDGSGNHVWSRSFGDAAEQSATAIAADGSGNVLVAGTLRGSVDFGGGALTAPDDGSALVLKLSAAGQHVWSKRLGDDGATGTAIASDASGNVLVTGDFRGTIDLGNGPVTAGANDDVFLAKLAPAGDTTWARTYGDDLAQHALGLAVGASGDVVITGSFGGTVSFGGGPLVSAGGFDLFLARFDAEGCPVHSFGWGSPLFEGGAAAAIDGAGNAAVVGAFSGATDFGGGTLTPGGVDALVIKRGP
jgi:hypothetical protein